MQLHQIQCRYDEMNDRLLLRFSTTESTEFRFWVTRRFLSRLWDLLLKLMQLDQPVVQQVDETAKKEVLAMRHEEFVKQGDFSKPFEEKQYTSPLGSDPVLLAVGEAQRKPDGNTLLRLRPQNGQGIDLNLNPQLLHTLTKLMVDAAAKSDWGLNLQMPKSSFDTDAEVPQSRVLN
jgi:hypothetical protein